MPPDPDRPVVQSERSQVFRALVEAQDQEMSVAQSRKLISERFQVSEAEVRKIEHEGLEGLWPPL